MANVRKYGCIKPIKRNYNPIRWVPKTPKGNKQKIVTAGMRKRT